MSCLITKKLEAIPTCQSLPAERASDDVKLCTCQIRTCAGEGEHVFASGRLVVWRNQYQGISIDQRQRVESVPIFSKSLHHGWFSCENPNCNKVKARLDSDENRNVLFRSSLSLITLTIAVQDCISVGDLMIRSGFNKSILTSFLFCQKMYIYI